MNLNKKWMELYELGYHLEQKFLNGNYKNRAERNELIVQMKENTKELKRVHELEKENLYKIK